MTHVPVGDMTDVPIGAMSHDKVSALASFLYTITQSSKGPSPRNKTVFRIQYASFERQDCSRKSVFSSAPVFSAAPVFSNAPACWVQSRLVQSRLVQSRLVRFFLLGSLTQWCCMLPTTNAMVLHAPCCLLPAACSTVEFRLFFLSSPFAFSLVTLLSLSLSLTPFRCKTSPQIRSGNDT